jgi:tetratricopeptide (TPR) repeat protein
MKKYLVFIMLLLMQSSFAIDDGEMKLLKTAFTEAINNEKNIQNKFYLLNLAGREFFFFREYSIAKEFYEKAIEVSGEHDKSEAYINILATDYHLKKSISKNNFDSALSYFKKRKMQNNDIIKSYLDFYAKSLMNKSLIDKDENQFSKGFFGQIFNDRNIKVLVERREYPKALLMINPLNLDEIDINSKIRFDILNTIVLGRTKHRLHCEKVLNKYPNTATFTMDACAILVNYMHGEKISAKTIDSLIAETERESIEHVYLVKALRDLK